MKRVITVTGCAVEFWAEGVLTYVTANGRCLGGFPDLDWAIDSILQAVEQHRALNRTKAA